MSRFLGTLDVGGLDERSEGGSGPTRSWGKPRSPRARRRPRGPARGQCRLLRQGAVADGADANGL